VSFLPKPSAPAGQANRVTPLFLQSPPTPLPNAWTGGADEIFSDLWTDVAADAASVGIPSELHKDWPV